MSFSPEEKQAHIYSVWLAGCLGAGQSYMAAVAQMGSEQAVFNASELEWSMLGIFKPAQLEKLSKRDLSAAKRIVQICENNSWHIISQCSEYYPVHLKNIGDPPSLIYAWGDAQSLKSELMISIVGAREASTYGRNVAFRLAASLARAGCTVVSGGALGIDTASHEGAVSTGGKTVSVMGCGLGSGYLPENEALRNMVSKHGAVISEYAPITSPTRASFPLRNRIISGMSLATVIVEAGEKSGSLGTARHAQSQGRDVCAVPGDLISSAFTGSNVLIANGAKPVFSAADVLSEYIYTYPHLIDLEKVERTLDPPTGTQIKVKPAAPEDLSETQSLVYGLFSTEPVGYDYLIENSGLTAPQLSQTLTELELKGIITGCAGRRYTIVD